MVILGLLDEAVKAGARQEKACELLGLSPRCLQRWRGQDGGDDRRAGPEREPANKLSEEERSKVIEGNFS